MRRRCRGYSDSRSYESTDCDVRWHDFQNFLADMGERQPGKTLDRIDNSRGYYPDNCRWATPTQQTRNRRNTQIYTWNGKTQTILEWAAELGITYNCAHKRIKINGMLDTKYDPVKRTVRAGSE